MPGTFKKRNVGQMTSSVGSVRPPEQPSNLSEQIGSSVQANRPSEQPDRLSEQPAYNFDFEKENEFVDGTNDPALLNDHKYNKQIPTKKTKIDMDEICVETLSVLKDIRNILDTRLGQIVDVVREFTKK